MNNLNSTLEVLYTSEFTRLLGVLVRIFGTHNIELAEDVLHESFSKALIHWEKEGIPSKPSAWIIKTAKNQAIDTIRSRKTSIKFSHDISQLLESEWSLNSTIDEKFKETHIKDDQLRMIFMCCDTILKPENSLPFILKTLCGFSISAIARALVLPEETIKKRLSRTRNSLKTHTFAMPKTQELATSLDRVHTTLYLLFNEGFYSSSNKNTHDIMLCKGAIGLVSLLLDEPSTTNQDTLALFALMHFHFARIDARTDQNGNNIPIDQQNRQLWRKSTITFAKQTLMKSTSSLLGASGRFFIEAHIAQEHCISKTFEDTNWTAITSHYERLTKLTNSPIARLHHAIAIGYTGNVELAIKKVESLKHDPHLKKSHMPLATLAHLQAKIGNHSAAYKNAELSKELGGTQHEHQIMMKQIERLLNQSHL